MLRVPIFYFSHLILDRSSRVLLAAELSKFIALRSTPTDFLKSHSVDNLTVSRRNQRAIFQPASTAKMKWGRTREERKTTYRFAARSAFSSQRATLKTTNPEVDRPIHGAREI